MLNIICLFCIFIYSYIYIYLKIHTYILKCILICSMLNEAARVGNFHIKYKRRKATFSSATVAQ